ncbi:MAG: hypothetical protein AAF840_18400 [Bacteroidota bacterium]
MLSIQNKAWAQEAPHPLVGTWVFDATTSFAQLDPGINTILDETPALRQQFNASYIGRTLIFTAQGEFTQQMANNITLRGLWAIEGQTLVINYPDGNNYKQEIGRIGPEQLLLIVGNPESILPQQYFVKQ